MRGLARRLRTTTTAMALGVTATAVALAGAFCAPASAYTMSGDFWTYQVSVTFDPTEVDKLAQRAWARDYCLKIVNQAFDDYVIMLSSDVCTDFVEQCGQATWRQDKPVRVDFTIPEMRCVVIG